MIKQLEKNELSNNVCICYAYNSVRVVGTERIKNVRIACFISDTHS